MKKIGMIALAALLVVAFTVPASAMESVFGGYWRTRMVTQNDFSGDDSGDSDLTRVDNRFRLYYTAVLNDNLKFVNKFEYDSVWGDTIGGDFGADGKGQLEVKNSYVDATMGAFNAKVGIQGAALGRGFLFNDDFSGLTLAFKGETFSLPFMWLKAYEGNKDAQGDFDDLDVDYYALAPSFKVSDGIKLNPYVMWATSDDVSGWNPLYHPLDKKVVELGFSPGDELDIMFYGLDVDMNFGGASLWFTGICEDGDIADADVSAYLLALGGAYNFDKFDIHGQGFYATGDDDWADDDLEAFWVPSQSQYAGQSYYWAEILGYGIFDENGPDGFPYSDKISNIWAANLGTKIKATEKMTIKFDVWYAELNESMVPGLDEELGWETDLVISCQLVPGLNLDLVGAYLFAGDSITFAAADDANPYELGAQLSLSF